MTPNNQPRALVLEHIGLRTFGANATRHDHPKVAGTVIEARVSILETH
jgi:hypothetical protein